MKLTSTNKPITCYNSTLFVVWLKTCSRPLCGSRETNRTPPDHPAGSINRSINRGGWGPGRTSRQCFGGHSDGETPGSIPNPEAKPVSADGTARGTGGESRSPPNILLVGGGSPRHVNTCQGEPPPTTFATQPRWGAPCRRRPRRNAIEGRASRGYDRTARHGPAGPGHGTAGNVAAISRESFRGAWSIQRPV